MSFEGRFRSSFVTTKFDKRAKQIERFAEVALRLRNMNNYSGLRAIVTAINQSTYPGDEVMDIFKQKTELHKKFLSSDILLRTSGGPPIIPVGFAKH